MTPRVNAYLQADQRTTDSFGLVPQRGHVCLGHVSKPIGYLQLARELAARPYRHLQKVGEFCGTPPPTAFGDVRTDRNGCPAHLRHQAEPLCGRKARRHSVHCHSEVLGVCPAPELCEVLHRSLGIAVLPTREPDRRRLRTIPVSRRASLTGEILLTAPDRSSDSVGLLRVHTHDAPRTTHYL